LASPFLRIAESAQSDAVLIRAICNVLTVVPPIY
jgi:hypothetical protein